MIHAEGEFQAAQRLADAAQVLSGQESALQLRYLQTLGEIATEGNSTTIFPIPIDILRPFYDIARRQEEEAAKGRPPGWTVPGGAEPIPDAMVTAWVTAKGLVPEQIPKELVDQYRRAMASAIKGLSATEDQAAQAVRHVLTHPDYAWYSYNHPKVEKFKQDVQSVILQILSGRFKANADGKLVEDVPLEELAQGTGYAAIMAYRELEERKMREAGEEVPKGLFDH